LKKYRRIANGRSEKDCGVYPQGVSRKAHREGWHRVHPAASRPTLVHLKGESREAVKDISWKKGVKMATARAEGKTGEKIPDSIKKQFEDFKKRAIMTFTEKFIPVEGVNNLAVAVANDGVTNQYSIVTTGRRHVRIFRGQDFMNLYKAMRKALAKKQENKLWTK
jgi:hypothetical protein